MPLVSSVSLITDPNTTKDISGDILNSPDIDDYKYLTDIAHALGRPPYLQDDELYRKMLTYVLSLYKIKGTIPAYHAWANLLGLKFQILELAEAEAYYDTGLRYDTPVISIGSVAPLTYDLNCSPCIEYVVIVVGVKESELSPEKIQLIKDVIAFNEPIDARLRLLLYSTELEDTIPTCMEENIKLVFSNSGPYDSGLLYDSGEYYDYPAAARSITITQTCSFGGEFDDKEFDNNFNIL